MVTDEMQPKRGRGRPRMLDRQKGIEIAERLFWSRGYENTSTTELTAAMGVTPPSLYAAYGSKENLFKQALDFYAASETAERFRLFAEAPTAFEAVKLYLLDTAQAISDPSKPKGCMISASLVHYSGENAGAAELVATGRRFLRETLQNRFEQAVRDGEIPSDTDCPSLARLYAGVVQGMSVQASDGASRAELLGLVQASLKAWPASSR